MSHRVHAAPAGLVLAAAIHGSPASGSARPLVASPGVGIDFAKLAGLQEGPPPWKANADSLLRARLDRLDLPVLSAEQLDYHIHVHLDVSIRGLHVPVPPNVGIDFVDQFLTVLHTHDATGVLHVESASSRHGAQGTAAHTSAASRTPAIRHRSCCASTRRSCSPTGRRHSSRDHCRRATRSQSGSDGTVSARGRARQNPGSTNSKGNQ